MAPLWANKGWHIPIALIILAFSLLPCTSAQIEIVCQIPIDIMMVLDGSGSIVANDWTRVVEFVAAVMNQTIISPELGHMGIVQFSTSALTTYDAHLTSNASYLNSIISAPLEQQAGLGTAIGDGLNLAQTDFNTLGRPTVGHTIILLTDGVSNQGLNPVTVSAAARANGTKIFAIGVGSGVDYGQLTQIASEPTSFYLFNLTAFADLDIIINTIVSKVCIILVQLAPDHGSSQGGTVITLQGEGFIDSPMGICRFVLNCNSTNPPVDTTVTYLNQSTITCPTPEGTPGEFTCVSFSPDLDSFTNELVFTFTNETVPPATLPMVAPSQLVITPFEPWAVAGPILGLSILFLITGLILALKREGRRRKRKGGGVFASLP